MHVLADSKVALRDAVTRPSKRLSSWELLDLAEQDRTLKAELARQRATFCRQRDKGRLICTGAMPGNSKPKKQQQENAYER